jgi:hypothetical protein
LAGKQLAGSDYSGLFVEIFKDTTNVVTYIFNTQKL